MNRRGAKQQHYIPETYIDQFVGEDGLITVRDIWGERQDFRTGPRNIFKQKDLYTQPVHAENRLDNKIEDLFGDLEESYPFIVKTLSSREALNQNQADILYQFASAMRVRVPHTQKAVLFLLAELVHRAADSAGIKVPNWIISGAANPLEDTYLDPELTLRQAVNKGSINLNIDPHRWISSMPYLVRSNLPMMDKLSLQFWHNCTDVDFIISDNPMIYYSDDYDPILPYEVSPDGSFEYIFPISKRICWRFSTKNSRKHHHSIYSTRTVDRINTVIGSFADRLVAGSAEVLDRYDIREFSKTPTPNFTRSRVIPSGIVSSIGYMWGIPIKPTNKWTYDFGWD